MEKDKPKPRRRFQLKNIFTPVRLLGLALLAGLIMLRITDPSFVEIFRLQAFDTYQQIKPREYTRQPVTIVDIDEEALQKYGQWPWPRTRIAELILKLAQQGAVVTSFDILFSEEDRLSPDKIAEDNQNLPEDVRAALKKLPDNETTMASLMKQTRVVLGQSGVRDKEDASDGSREIIEAGYAALGEDPKPFLQPFESDGLVQNIKILEDAASGRGVINATPDADGVIRKVPLIMLVRDKIKLALSAETLRIATGGLSFATKTDAAGLNGIVVAKNLVPTDSFGRVWPYFTQPDSSKYVSAARVLDGTADPSRIGGHMILVGTSAVGLEDYRAIPLGTTIPGVEIHAQVIENILAKTMLTRPSTAIAIELAIVLALGLLIVILVPKLGAIWSFSGAAIVISAFIATSYWAFSTHRILIDPTYPVLATLALFILMTAANYIREEQQKQQIRGAFGQYLSPALVEQLSDDPDRLVLGGETRELSVLFSDVRGFTTISESYKDYPEGLTKLMNRFLTILSQPILDRNGTIDKYMGDAIMAFWNAPVDDENHAVNSCKAALAMMDDVHQFNETRSAEPKIEGETYHEINVGVGINTGMCVVGNMGSALRFDYTCLGDTVNLASRLEGQSKPYGLAIILGDGTAKIVASQLATIEIDLIKVKGKNDPERIHALFGDEEFAKKDDYLAFRALNATMISSYRNQDWASAYEALELMEGVAEKLKINITEYLFIYETRIAEFRTNPPGPAWDGVYTATSK